MRPDLKVYLGQQVTVVVDRPLGSRHPDHAIWYPVNYGYVPGTLAPDGEPIDAYLLGVFEPVREATGVVIAIVLRADDIEDKLVVAPAGKHYSASQIEALIEFQERFWDSRVVIAESLPATEI
ncbi:MAG: inorganic diphosphatase [Chloroflexi bacterium]|nr:inorganic diphosphatase [Chloroflexota bacterium]MBU1750238.1 inorganic diphosphatase [Chloroflexota bacterium]MBU1879182.1 inorganic diphosphatase [Chloroflexota bacterium]